MGQKKKKYSFGGKNVKQRKGFGSNKDEIFKNIRKELIKLIDASKTNDYKAIEESPFNVQFKNKVAYLYNPKKQMPVYSNDDLNIILTVLEIPFNIEDSCESKRKKLYEFYKKNKFDKKMSTCLFMNFIYSSYGYRSDLRGVDAGKIGLRNLDDIKLVDVKIKSRKILKKPKKSKRKSNVKPNHDQNLATGKLGEKIVRNYLKTHKDELNIKYWHDWCEGKTKDDGKGYDFSYETIQAEKC